MAVAFLARPDRRMNRRFLSHHRRHRHSRRRVATVWFLLALSAGGVPVHAQKPELLDPRVTQSTIVDTICRPGYADDVLPPFDTLQRQKEQLLSQRHVDPQTASDYALDHRMPILLGGSPTAAANLDIRRWDGRAGQRRKERLAVFLKRCVCTGDMPLAAAQAAMSGDWPNRFRNLSSPTCNGS
jgi:hypothetical protein